MKNTDDEWYKHAFNADYSAIYSHRDDSSAAHEVEWALSRLNLPASAHVLDLCCGNGRHSRQLVEHGCHVLSIDLSKPLLKQAKSRQLPHNQVACADMRFVPVQSRCLDAVFSFFTSFGYFHDDHQNTQVIHEISRTLKPNGLVLFDFLNADYVKETLVPHSHTEKDGHVLIQDRRITTDGKRVEKDVVFQQPGKPTEKYRESVRLFSATEIAEIFRHENLQITERFGSFQGDPFSTTTSRLVVFAKKTDIIL